MRNSIIPLIFRREVVSYEQLNLHILYLARIVLRLICANIRFRNDGKATFVDDFHLRLINIIFSINLSKSSTLQNYNIKNFKYIFEAC